jgi:hypothetical protein
MLTRIHVIHERSSIIPIKQNLSTTMKQNSPKGEYSLKQNFFDPNKSSPPNEFIVKLHKRMSVYNSPIQTFMNDDNLVKE